MRLRKPSASKALLANFDAAAFLAEDWQRQPRLIRQGLPEFECPVDGNDLAGLACEEDIDSRLIIQQDDQWHLESGPFAEDRFANLPASQWTLLVQAVDAFIPEVADLNRFFRFLPRWRQQDIMVSYAAPGGNVGPHFDQYDVFLIQGSGQRRWQIGQRCDTNTALRNNPQLQLMADFQCQQEFLLGPGDILYIPPGCAHWGVAESPDCITLSVGFRAPAVDDMLQDLGQFVGEQSVSPARYTDPLIKPTAHWGEISDAALAQAHQLLSAAVNDPRQLSHWFGQLMTHRAAPAFPGELDATQFSAALADHAVFLALGARLAFRGTDLFADGEMYQLGEVHADALASFCRLEPGDIISPNTLPHDILFQLYQRGTLTCALDDE